MSRTHVLATLAALALVAGCGTQATPVITKIDPAAVCDSMDPRSFTITGTSFLNDGTLPKVTLTSVAMPTTQVPGMVTAATGCMDQLCTTLAVTVPKAMLPDGKYKVTVTNDCDGCVSTQDVPVAELDVVGPPTLTSVMPDHICSGGGTLTLTGTNLYPGGTVTLGTTKAMSVMVNSDGTQATVTFGGNLPVSMLDGSGNPIPVDITYSNAMGCDAKLPMAVTVTPGPSILFVDPPAVPVGYQIQATVYAAGVSPPIKSVSIAPTGTTTWQMLAITNDPNHPNRVLVTLPGNLAAGAYDMQLDDQTTCTATLTKALTVNATATLTVTSVTPAFGSPSQNTAVAIAGTGFVSTPRAYMAISGGGAGVTASALRAVTFNSATALTAVVPAGLQSGTYDLIVTNPDGSFGVEMNAFTVTDASAPPPVVTSVAPSSVVVATNAMITIQGTDFRSPSVTATCYDGAGAMLSGAMTTVASSTATTISGTLFAPSGAFYCILRVTDTDNMTFFDFSAVGVTNSSLNLTGFHAGTDMTTARRALGAAAGRPTDVARFVYAIGGDNGSDNMPTDSVEAAPTGLDGSLGNFFVLSQKLPKPISFLQVVTVGRFLYAVGGFDGSAAIKDAERAELLDPLDTPAISDVDVRVDMTKGLDPGLYTYRIAAVMDPSDDNNPSGETLASDFFPIQLPTVTGGKLDLVLFWSQFTGSSGMTAKGYRIYRSVKAGDAAGSELLLATVDDNGKPTQNFVDDGSKTPAGDAPLPLGSTGAWKPLGQLMTARAGAAVTVAPDPSTAGTWYLYALGGNSGTIATPALETSGEMATITAGNNGRTQAVGSWTSAGAVPTARWLGPGLVATNAQNTVVPPGQTWVYVGSGLSTSLTTGTVDKPVYVAQVMGGGALGAFASTGSVGVGRGGYGAALVNNQMMAFGGDQGGTPTTASVTATLASPTTLGNFNSLGGGVLTSTRALQGTAIESAFIYQLGGASATATAQKSTEQTIW